MLVSGFAVSVVLFFLCFFLLCFFVSLWVVGDVLDWLSPLTELVVLGEVSGLLALPVGDGTLFAVPASGVWSCGAGVG